MENLEQMSENYEFPLTKLQNWIVGIVFSKFRIPRYSNRRECKWKLRQVKIDNFTLSRIFFWPVEP